MLFIQRRVRERGLEKRVQVEKERTVKGELLFQRDREGNMVTDRTLETKFLDWIADGDGDWVG